MAIAYILTDPEFFSAQGFPYQSRMETPEWPAGFYAESYPQVVQLLRNPKGGEDQIRLNYDWLQYLDAINTSDKIFSKASIPSQQLNVWYNEMAHEHS